MSVWCVAGGSATHTAGARMVLCESREALRCWWDWSCPCLQWPLWKELAWGRLRIGVWDSPCVNWWQSSCFSLTVFSWAGGYTGWVIVCRCHRVAVLVLVGGGGCPSLCEGTAGPGHAASGLPSSACPFRSSAGFVAGCKAGDTAWGWEPH